MSRVAPFHSLNESRKGAPRYHTDDACDQAQLISPEEYRLGSGGYYLCQHCAELQAQRLSQRSTRTPES